MEIHKIQMKLNGQMTQLPDSQKIFGCLMYLFSDQYGHEKGQMFVKAVKQKQITLMISDMLPENYIPTPKNYLISRYQGDGKKEYYKQIKKLDFVSKCQWNLLSDISSIDSNVFNFDYISKVSSQQIRLGIKEDVYQLAGIGNDLYSVPKNEYVLIPHSSKSKEHKVITDYEFFVGIPCYENIYADLVDKFLSCLYSLVEKKEIVVLGKRASQGFNLFTFKSAITEKVNNHNSNHYLNLGMMIPEHIDYNNSVLQLYTSDRRPFEMVGSWDTHIIEKDNHFLSFISSGSIIACTNKYKLNDLTQSIEAKFDKNSIVFGNSFLYPLQSRGALVYE
ncbi:hypothetical protein BHU72_05890 [Desulfuribacillus stibiiarsenatis]|uniref:Uncharacterized protein n=1 Tax=Desulfuribacillus stibiiarsenatis TaxID=1390249 RepID=A0A1E5L4V3_9FIRM|nr:hypothetical protein [Desulfuribacillus stibiiarsenatis]OEH85141.1 hypothetical protein BHU72_05890 [Desulfuribacillus stibiiarsenatis]